MFVIHLVDRSFFLSLRRALNNIVQLSCTSREKSIKIIFILSDLFKNNISCPPKIVKIDLYVETCLIKNIYYTIIV